MANLITNPQMVLHVACLTLAWCQVILHVLWHRATNQGQLSRHSRYHDVGIHPVPGVPWEGADCHIRSLELFQEMCKGRVWQAQGYGHAVGHGVDEGWVLLRFWLAAHIHQQNLLAVGKMDREAEASGRLPQPVLHLHSKHGNMVSSITCT